MKRLPFAAIIAACICFMPGCRKDDIGTNLPAAATAETPVDETEDVASYARCSRLPADVAFDWMQAVRQVVKSEAKNPAQASRIYAYTALGLYEAVQPSNAYRSMKWQIIGLTTMPNACTYGRIDYIVAANEAMYQVTKKIFVTLKPDNTNLLDSLHNDYITDAAQAQNNTVINNSINFGSQVAVAVLNRADNDNFAATRSLVYTVPSQSVNPAYWAPTGSVLTPLEPYWGTIKGFALTNNASCTVKSTVAFDATAGSAFYNQANEVATAVLNLTQQQKDIALWWADGTGSTPTPPGHWVSIGVSMSRKFNLSLGDVSRMFAELNMGMADAFISCWNEKYTLNLLRPVSYIRTYIAGQTAWSSFITTPPFPEYPSGHSVGSAAAADILTRMFGNVSFVDSANANMGFAPRTFASFTEAASEAGISRLYGGIHFREAIDNGLVQGKLVSKNMNRNIRFR